MYGTFSDPDFFIKALTLWRFENMINGFLAYFHWACAETAI